MAKSNQYGPWATSINAFGSPQLSTFWRRRMTRLAAASQANLALSTRSLIGLAVTSVLMWAMPTIHFATAGEDGTSPSNRSDAAADRAADKASDANRGAATASGNNKMVGLFSTTFTGDFKSFLPMPMSVYYELSHANMRKELKITPDQEKKLFAISREYMERHRKAIGQLQKELQGLTPQEREAKQTEAVARLRLTRQAEDVRKQIEMLLTAEQISALTATAIGRSGLGLLMIDEQVRKNVGVTNQQIKELDRLLKDQQQQLAQFAESMNAMEQKLLAVVTPQQWERLERSFAAGDTALKLGYPSAELIELLRDDVSKQVGLTAEQRAKVAAAYKESQSRLTRDSQSTSAGVNNLVSAEKQAKYQAEMASKLAEMTKKDREQVKSILTKPQFEALMKIVTRRNFIRVLDMLLYTGALADPGAAGPLGEINLSKEQWAELRRLQNETDRMLRQNAREAGESLLKIFSPQQQEKVIAEWERSMTEPRTASPAKEGKPGVTATFHALVVEGSESKEGNKPDRPAKPEQYK